MIWPERYCRGRWCNIRAYVILIVAIWLFVFLDTWIRPKQPERQQFGNIKTQRVTPTNKEMTCMNGTGELSSSQLVITRTHTQQCDIVATMVQRYGYKHQLSFAIGQDTSVISHDEKFRRNMGSVVPRHQPKALQYTKKQYNVLASYVRFNKPEINAVVPNATYITVIVEPSYHLQYVFNLYSVDRSLHINKYRNPLEKFMETPQMYIDKRFKFWFQLHNGQLFDLGFDDSEYRLDRVKQKIVELERELDFVLIGEYLDESLVVLKKKLCLEWKDIMYLPIRNVIPENRRYTTETLRRQILDWNAADSLLYQHFNKTLWIEIGIYGPSFQSDLFHHKTSKQRLWDDCLVARSAVNDDIKLKPNAGDFCNFLYRSEKELWKVLGNKQ
ncbi:galactosylceramide sulfotransferase-like [Saccoglossus kowalevskii]|uniref:Galactosylceramide sulfotransferase-like n=1 Tax=Saccoglossus kowalevskii TaxID=10224 RepID=A0ABM0LYQ6_SACKO|nr:PREDICTED: galactosylceramide sulfotransferase-like [Saccoglossus kowalevskii]